MLNKVSVLFYFHVRCTDSLTVTVGPKQHTNVLLNNNTQYRQVTLEQLVADGMQQTHMFGSLDRQFADGVVVYHLRYTAERLTELTENVANRPRLGRFRGNLHVHETTTASAADNMHRTMQLMINSYRFILLNLRADYQLSLYNRKLQKKVNVKNHLLRNLDHITIYDDILDGHSSLCMVGKISIPNKDNKQRLM